MPFGLRIIPLVLACLLLDGCIMAATRGIGTVERQIGIGEEFRDWQAHRPPIPAGRGRLVVYPGGSRSFVYETTGIGKGGEQLFAVDRDVCTVLGHSFVYLDLPAGPHEISAEGVSTLFGYQKGKNKLPLQLAPAGVTYIRIGREKHGVFSRSHYAPSVVEAAAAEAELMQYPLYRDGLTCRPNKAEDRPSGG